jgi:hypothetical protein
MESFLHDISWVVPYRTPELTQLFNGLTWLGYTNFFLIFLPIGYWLWDKHMFTRLAVLIIITGALNSFLKDLFHDPRPPLALSIDPRASDSFGLPSGHAQVAVAMWLWLAYEIGRVWAWVSAFIIALGVCASRVYLGVHDLEDIIGGALLGLATIFAYRTLVSDEFNFWHKANGLLQLAVILAIQPLVWFAWPGGPNAGFAIFGFLFGWWAGVVIERNFIHLGKPANWLAAVIISILAVTALLFSLKPLEQILLAQGAGKLAVGWIQASIIGLYAAAIIPLLLRVTRVSHAAAS